jgi:hypothetical protein
MSIVIEAIIYQVSKEEFDSEINRKIKTILNPFDLELTSYQLEDLTGIVVCTDSNRIFNEIFIEIAQKISTEFNKALLIKYDDRIGYRHSSLYVEGILTNEFGLENEIWVLIDEEGEPLLDKRFSSIQVENDDDDENEYQTIYNSIELGLDGMGLNRNWKEVFSSIIKHLR